MRSRSTPMTYWTTASNDRLLKVEHRIATCEEAIRMIRNLEDSQPATIDPSQFRLQHQVADLEELKLITDAYVMQLEQEAIRLKATANEEHELLNKARRQAKAHWQLLTQMAHDLESLDR